MSLLCKQCCGCKEHAPAPHDRAEVLLELDAQANVHAGTVAYVRSLCGERSGRRAVVQPGL
eukprot:7265716-Alexandrium_andersonii.AAC.1